MFYLEYIRTGPPGCWQEKNEMPYKNKSDKHASDARYRAQNRTRIRERTRSYLRKRGEVRKKHRQAFIKAYKATHTCVDCGEIDPALLEFDHRDHLTKKFNVSQMIWRGNRSVAAIQEEIAKCDLRCIRCHRKKTAGERHLWSQSKLKSSESTLFD
jgi:hypothetical protein